jgi:hypothetical protein
MTVPDIAPAAIAHQRVVFEDGLALDSGAVVAAIVTLFADESATWNTTQQLTLLAASIDPAWLPPLVADLSRLRFNVTTERTRAAVLGLAEHRHAMVQSFEHARTHARPDGPSHPEST